MANTEAREENNKRARRRVPEDVRRAILIEAGYRCAVPTCRAILTIEIHHIVEVAKGGWSTRDNLLALCPNCHALHHQGTITQEAIRVYKGMLLALTRGFDREAMDNLLFLTIPDRPVYFSADGVLRFVSLMASGLVRTREGAPGMNPTGIGADPSRYTFVIELTEKGQRVVEAWKRGDPAAFGVNEM
jgi:hypothetical protein